MGRQKGAKNKINKQYIRDAHDEQSDKIYRLKYFLNKRGQIVIKKRVTINHLKYCHSFFFQNQIIFATLHYWGNSTLFTYVLLAPLVAMNGNDFEVCF